MNHVCNAWCFDGVHAILFDSEATERPVLAAVAPQLAARAGLEYIGHVEVRATGAPVPGTPTNRGVARGRFVIWAR